MKNKKTYPPEVYLNDQWLKPEEASISVFDRGFMFGDGIYEVTPFYHGKPFRLEAHLERLRYCLDEIKISFIVSTLEKLIFEAVSRGGYSEKDAAVYIQITRGTAPRTHYFPEASKPTVLLYAFPVALQDFESKRWKVIISEDFRWQRCDIKSTALLANCMANEEANSNGFDENLLFRNGYFTEGSHSTAFFVKNGQIYTHPEGPYILSGITRQIVLEICRKLELTVHERPLHLEELPEVEEIFLTGTTTQITAVSSLHDNEKELFSSERGEITARLQEEFRKLTRG